MPAVVVCGILKAEVEAALREAGIDVPVSALSPAPCIDYEVLRRQLEGSLSRAKAVSGDVVVVIGRCHPDIDDIIGRHAARRLDMHDCFEALLGRAERRRLDGEAETFYTTPAWLPHWRRAISRGMRWDEADVRQNFRRYERVLMLDSGLNPISDEDILEFFDCTGVPVEVQPVSLEELRHLLSEALGAK